MPSLAAVVERELALVERFLAILLVEQAALRRGAVDGLEAFTAAKAEMASRLNAASDEREAWLASEGAAAGRSGLEAWLAAHPEDQAAGKAWRKLIAVAEASRDANRLNGQLIAQRLQFTHQALVVLAGETPAAGLYDRDGQSTRGTGSRIIDAA